MCETKDKQKQQHTKKKPTETKKTSCLVLTTKDWFLKQKKILITVYYKWGEGGVV